MSKLTIKDATGETEKVVRAKHSMFFLTVNTNQPFLDANAPEFKEAKRELSNAILSRLNGQAIYGYIKFESGSRKDIISLDEDAALERSTINKFLHIHVIMHFKHQAKIKFDIAKFRAEVNKELGRTCYMNVRASGAGVSTLKEYLAKHLKGSEEINSDNLEHIKMVSHVSNLDKEPRYLDRLTEFKQVDKIISKAMNSGLSEKLESKFNELSEHEDELTKLLASKGSDSIAVRELAKRVFTEKLEFIDAIDKINTNRGDHGDVKSISKKLFKLWYTDYTK